jgi:hypothetical protein
MENFHTMYEKFPNCVVVALKILIFMNKMCFYSETYTFIYAKLCNWLNLIKVDILKRLIEFF